MTQPASATRNIGEWDSANQVNQEAKTRDRAGWRSFSLAMVALAIAFALAVYSGAAAQVGALWTAAVVAIVALALAAWVAITIVPALARRTPLRWLAFHIDYKVTREGVVYLVGVFVVALAALNTGNNLLFLILGCQLAGILLSGIFSRMTLTGVELQLEVPEHVFAGEPATAVVELRNLKRVLPSFALSVVADTDSRKDKAAKKLLSRKRPLLDKPVYFPYLPHGQAVQTEIDLVFPRRGVFQNESLAIRSRFPFGFLEKTRTVAAEAEIFIYPSIEPTDTFYEVLPLMSGELESYQRGRGNDLYSIRDLVQTDSARFVDWKATAKSGALKVREFAREDERRVLLALDPFAGARPVDAQGAARAAEQFESAVSLCACLAWHFSEIESVMGFRAPGVEIPVGPATENIFDILKQLAVIERRPHQTGSDFLAELARDPSVFKIVLTSQPRGSIPTALWSSAYMVFLDSL
jgi:uncharacterized protein (DUF58 family)